MNSQELTAGHNSSRPTRLQRRRDGATRAQQGHRRVSRRRHRCRSTAGTRTHPPQTQIVTQPEGSGMCPESDPSLLVRKRTLSRSVDKEKEAAGGIEPPYGALQAPA
jgi:hypothetical protein